MGGGGSLREAPIADMATPIPSQNRSRRIVRTDGRSVVIALLLVRLVPLIGVWLLATHLLWRGLTVLVIDPLGIGRPGGPPIIAVAFVVGVVFLVRWVPIIWLLVWVAPRWGARLERKRLVRLGYPICVACGYDAGAPADRCPECGRETPRR